MTKVTRASNPIAPPTVPPAMAPTLVLLSLSDVDSGVAKLLMIDDSDGNSDVEVAKSDIVTVETGLSEEYIDDDAEIWGLLDAMPLLEMIAPARDIGGVDDWGITRLTVVGVIVVESPKMMDGCCDLDAGVGSDCGREEVFKHLVTILVNAIIDRVDRGSLTVRSLM